MTQYLVTGGAGFIGSHLVESLVRRGASVRVLDNFSTGSIGNLSEVLNQIELIEGDASDPKAAAAATRDVEIVFHQAAVASVARSLEDPLATHLNGATATLTILEAARQAGVRRVIHAGSSSAYGDCDQPTKSETLPANPLSPYAAAKLSAEYYCQAFSASLGLPTVTLRYFNVFGPRQDPNSPYSAVIPRFMTALFRGEKPVIYGDGLQSRDFTYVDNVVHGNLLAAQWPAETVSGRVFNIAHGENTSLLKLIEMLGAELGTEVEPIFEPARQGDVRHSRADLRAARQWLKYEPPVDFQTGLRRTLEYYRSEILPKQQLTAAC